MPLYKPSELSAFLRSLGLAPKDSLSQNFLIDGNIIRKIVSTASVTSNDLILEIGPGPGALTEELLAHGAKVIAVEKDDALASALPRLSKQPGDLIVYHEDILSFPLENIIKEHLGERPKAKVIANLPYHLTGAIIQRLVDKNSLFSSLTLMVQEEVAHRYIAKPRTKDYSSFTIFLQVYANVSYAFKVPNTCFYPVPKVSSAVVSLELHPPPSNIVNLEEFFTLTRTAFAHRRKMLKSTLKTIYPLDKIMTALEDLDLPIQARPEELTLEQFSELYQELVNLR